jgi:hypothetical protein
MVDAHIVHLPTSSRLLATPSTFRRRSSATTSSTWSPHASSPLLHPSPPYASHRPRRILHFVFKSSLAVLAIFSIYTLVNRYDIDSGLRSYTSLSRVARASSNLTLSEFLNAHFPLDLELNDSPHLWITLADYEFTGTGAANLDVFFKQLNVERRAFYGKEGRKPRDSVLVTLCLDEGCARECEKRNMYCYEGYENTRPPMVSYLYFFDFHSAKTDVSLFSNPDSVILAP